MYSVVLMAALTAGTNTPTCHWKCHGGGWGGCYGCSGCYGGYGGFANSGWGCYGCVGCYGGCWGNPYGGHGCYGCYGCAGCGGYYAPASVVPSAPAPKEKDAKTTSINKPAKLIVDLPADAKLYVDNQLMKTASEKRVFNTPTLQPGQLYFYDLKAEVIRDGEKFTSTKRVIIRAGEEIRASFTDLETTAVTAED